MKARIIYLFLVILSLSLIGLACEGPEGPQGEQGPEGPVGPAGEDGNANVTRYIFDGHDFSANSEYLLFVEGVSEEEM